MNAKFICQFTKTHRNAFMMNTLYSSFVRQFQFQNALLGKIQQRNFSSSLVFWKNKKLKAGDKDEEFDVQNLIDNDKNYNTLLMELGGNLLGISSLAVIQPWVKWGPEKRKNTKADILLDEACALVKSLPSTSITYKATVPCASLSRSSIFGSGSMERLAQEIQSSRSQALFISIDHLSRAQRSDFESFFNMRVFDRYFIVLAIFKYHATSLEAKLQIAIAELPFMSKRSLTERDKLILDERESKLKAAVKKLSNRREKIRKTRQKSSLASVAVVGYTNCGKTSVIRALTGDRRAQGENRLFATLDVTAHRGSLPCGLNVLFLDTVGFIQDIPTTLIASFEATLQDAIHADVVVLVRDPGHPDAKNHSETVRDTLKSLPVSDETPVVVVNNKADLLTEEQRSDACQLDGGILSSAITGEGLNELLDRVQMKLLEVTGRKIYVMRLPTGSPKIEWLNANMGVASEEVDMDNPQLTKIHVVLNEAEKARFRRAFS